MKQAHPAGPLADLPVLTPDARQVITRVQQVTPIAGRPAAPVRETGHLVRYGRVVMVNVPAAGPLRGEITIDVSADEREAIATYARLLHALEGDGWDTPYADDETPTTETPEVSA